MAIDNKKILIVYGRETVLRERVARFLEHLGAKPIILAEQSFSGMTTLQSLKTYSDDVGFAIILLTGDDRGGGKDVSYNKQKPRSQQDVIFELGYLTGKLGRDRVCVLYESGVEIPGIFYAGGMHVVPYDEFGGWKIAVARELQDRGIDININRLLPGDSTTDAPPPKKH